MSNNPQLLYVAGPNGAGKSTFSKDLSEPGAIIFDVDKVIARIETQSPGILKKRVYDTATQVFFDEANKAVRLRQHFTLETNFRDKGLVDIAAQFKQFGYTTTLVYLTLESVEESISRVHERVLNGGHFVDHRNILLNFNEGLVHLEHFADRFDKLTIINSSKDTGKFKSLLKIDNRQLVYLADNLPVSVRQAITNIADRFKSSGLDDDENTGPTRGRGR